MPAILMDFLVDHTDPEIIRLWHDESSIPMSSLCSPSTSSRVITISLKVGTVPSFAIPEANNKGRAYRTAYAAILPSGLNSPISQYYNIIRACSRLTAASLISNPGQPDAIHNGSVKS